MYATPRHANVRIRGRPRRACGASERAIYSGLRHVAVFGVQFRLQPRAAA